MEEGGLEIRFQGRLSLLLLLSLVLFLSKAEAVTLSELSERASRAVAGGMSEAEEQALFGDLADVSVEVANRYDQWVRTGTAEARASAASLADGLLPVLERLYDHHQGRIDRAQNEIIAQDGNPEVLYEEKWWQLDRGFALAAAGQLSWLHYRSAMLHQDQKEKRERWLRKAVKEFGEFVYAQDPKMAAESLLGRAMAEKELGERDAAAGDLQVIIGQGRDNPIYWPARLTLAELRVSGGGPDALSETQKLLADASAAGLPGETLNQIRLLRFEALSVAGAKGNESARRDAQEVARDLAALGPAWSRRVQQIAMSRTKDPRQLVGSVGSAEWIAAENLASEEKFKEAIPAYEAVLKSTDPAAREKATEAHHRLGICHFRLGNWVAAEKELRTFLNQAPKSPLAGEAAFLQFRAAEALFRAQPTADTRGRFVSVVENYVKSFPKHPSVHEGWYRLGEIAEGERRFQEAADAYAKVKGSAAFEMRAASAEVLALADLLSAAPKDATKEWAEPIRQRAAEAFGRFEKLAGAQKADPDVWARTVLAKAMTEVAGPAPRLEQSLATLRDFEKKYPKAAELLPLVGALRVAVASGLVRYEDAERGVAMLPTTATRDARFVGILEKIARNFLRTASDVATTDPTAGQKWAALAAAVYDRLKAEGVPVPDDAKENLARVYVEQGRLDDAAAFYRDLLKASPQSKTLLRNAAMVADRRKAAKDSAEYWGRLAMLQEVATPAWYEARLATARGLVAAGQGADACRSVREVENFRPDLRNAETKREFSEIAGRACPGSS